LPEVNFTATAYGLWNNNFDGDTNVTPPRAGMYLRSNGYVYETLCQFDVSSLAGKTIDSAYLQFQVTDSGSGTEAQTVYAMEQNKTDPDSWSSPPIYDDFGNFPGTHEYWDTELNNVGSVLDNGWYTILDSGSNIKDLVQSWIDDAADNWGIVLTRSDNATTRWIEISQVKLYVTYTEPGGGTSGSFIFNTPGSQSFKVPRCVTQLTVKAWGAGGGGAAGGTASSGGAGGGGGYVKGTIAVTPGETLTLHVGGMGENGTYPGAYSGGGGGGGGRSSIFRGSTALFIAGAGGGGGGGDNSSGTAGGAGGAGGGTTGGSGGASSSAGGGGGGTQTAGGDAGIGGANYGSDGDPFINSSVDFHNCLSFGGTNEYVNISGYKGITGTGARSCEALIRTESRGYTILSWGSASGDGAKWVFKLEPTTGQLRVEVTNGYVIGTTVLDDGKWHRVACTFPASGNVTDTKLYVDGVEETISSSSSRTVNTSSSLDVRIGNDVGTSYWLREIDDVRIWNDVRTLSELSDNAWVELNGDESGLEAYWKMNETSGTNVADSTSNGRDGTTQNMEDSDWVRSLVSGAGGNGGDGRNNDNSKGNEDNGGITNGGAGGGGNMGAQAGFAGGGGGGSGRAGGGGGSCSASGNAGGGGGGGGSNYIIGTATDTSNQQASSQTPPNTSDDDYGDNAGYGGNGGGTTSNGSDGNDGRIVIITIGASSWGITKALATNGTGLTQALAFGGISPDIDNMLLDRVVVRIGDTHSAQARLAVYSGPAQGNCLNFDGDPEYVDIGNDSVFNFTNNFTLECWVYIPSDHGQTGVIRWIGSRNGDNGVGFGYNTSNGYLRYTSFGKHDYESNQSCPLDRWFHAAVTINGTNDARFYIDGQFTNQVNNSNPATTTGINMTLGQAGNDTEYFVGKLDEVRMWSDVRTDAEIYDNMHLSVSPSAANLVGYWKLNESSGTNAADETSNDNDGTLTNMEDADWQTSGVVFTPPTAFLVKDCGKTSGSGTEEWQELDGGLASIPKNTQLWIAMKLPSGFSVRYNTSPEGSDFQRADGRFASAAVSTDPDVAFPAAWPTDSSGAYSRFWYSLYLVYNTCAGELIIPCIYRGVGAGIGRGAR